MTVFVVLFIVLDIVLFATLSIAPLLAAGTDEDALATLSK